MEIHSLLIIIGYVFFNLKYIPYMKKLRVILKKIVDTLVAGRFIMIVRRIIKISK